MTAAPYTDALRSFFGLATDRQAHKHFAYLALAVPLGLLYYVLLGFGFVLGVTLSVFLVGIPLLLGTLLAARALADVERRLANRLLDTDIPPGPSLPSPSGDGLREWGAALVGSETTWRAVGFLVLKSLVGFVTWLFALVAGFTALALTSAPLGTVTLMETWTIDTFAEQVVAVPVGISLGFAALHVLDKIAEKTGQIAASLLEVDSQES